MNIFLKISQCLPAGIIFWLFSVMTPAIALADDNFTPEYHPKLHVTKTSNGIELDGDLNDPGWRAAGKADNFAEHWPGDQTKPPVKTEVLVTYNDDNLFVAFICYDDPSTIRASFCDRDHIFSDDNICLLIDTYGDAAWAYELNVNPYGIQGDLLWSKNIGEDSGYDMVWESAGKITDSGYQLEMAIPFSSLRFPNKSEQVWKMDFWRNHPREIRRQYSWAAYDRNDPCWPCKWGTVTGIKNVKPGKGIDIMPTFIGYVTGERDEHDKFINHDPDGEFSIGARYSVTSNITAEAAYNPDFSQVEADADQIDVNTKFALFYSERRPFFQEGSDLFSTFFSTVYTRSVNDPQFAAKMTGRLNRTSLAFLSAYDEHSPVILPFEESSGIIRDAGKSYSNIFRIRQTFGDDSHIGGLITDRRLDGGGSGSLLSADGVIKLSQNYQVEYQFLSTHTEEPDNPALTSDIEADTFDDGKYTAAFDGESFWGHGIYASFECHARHLDLDFDFVDVSPTFRADNGFETSNSFREIEGYAAYAFYPKGGFISQIYPEISASKKWNYEGETKSREVRFDISFNFNIVQGASHIAMWRYSERYNNVQFDDLWTLHTCGSARIGDPVAFGYSVNYGRAIDYDKLVAGHEFSFYPWFDIKPMDRLLVENWFNYIKGTQVDTKEELYKGYIYRSRMNYQLSKEMTLRVIVQYNDFSHRWDIDPLLRYRINSFSVFYIGSTIDYDDYSKETDARRIWKLSSRQFFMKLQYLFQV